MLQIEWYTIPLPRVAGSAGGKHSFLVITTCRGRSGSRYVLEKAQPQNSDHDGTFVSFFHGSNGSGVGASLMSDAECFRSNKEHVKEGLAMTDLVTVCEGLRLILFGFL